ncbi:MAG: DUF2723 domain-containing protein [Bacteroidota bacterium]
MAKNRYLTWMIFGLIGLIYWLTKNPFLSFGDSIGVLYYASLGFDWATNATSHFLYLNLCHILILPQIGNPVSLLTGLSIVFAMGCLYRLYLLIDLASGKQSIALITSLIFAVSFSWWRQAVTIEVYSMSMWIAMEIFWAMGQDVLQEENKRSWQVAIWMAVAMLTHIQFLLLLPAVGMYWMRGEKNWKQRLGPIGLFALLVSPLFLLPILLQTHPLSAIFFDHAYQGQVLQMDIKNLFFGGLRSIGYLIYNFHVFLPLLVWGIWINWKKRRAWTLLLLLAAAPIWGFAMRYNVTDSYVFFLLPYLVLCILGADGVGWLEEKIRPLWLRVALTICLSPLMYLCAWQVAEQIPRLQIFAEPKAYKGGLRYYFWPGQSQSADPIQLAREIHEEKRPTIPDFDRYELVVKYLDL